MRRRNLPPPLDSLVPDWQSVWLLAFSLALAVLFWAITVSEEKSLKDLTVPLEFANVPPRLMVVGEDAHRMVTVEIKGPPDMLRRVREEDVEARIDVGKLAQGPQVVEIGSENVRLPSSVELARVIPKTVHFTLDGRADATVPMAPTFVGHTGAGLQVVSWSIDPPTVVIEGPESSLRRIRQAPTQPVSLEGRSQGFQVPVVPNFTDPDITVTNLEPFSLKVDIGEKRSQRTIGPVPIQILKARYPTVLEPPSLRVMVDGPESVVRGLAPQDFHAEVNVTGLEPSDHPYELRPAVRFANPSLGSRVEITAWIQRFVQVTVMGAGDAPASQAPAPDLPPAGQPRGTGDKP